jgi:hypothetical protein
MRPLNPVRKQHTRTIDENLVNPLPVKLKNVSFDRSTYNASTWTHNDIHKEKPLPAFLFRGEFDNITLTIQQLRAAEKRLRDKQYPKAPQTPLEKRGYVFLPPFTLV